MAMGLFAVIVSLVLGQIRDSRSRQAAYLEQEEIYQLVKMAVQTRQSDLSLNGQRVRVSRSERGLKIYHKEELLLEIEEE